MSNGFRNFLKSSALGRVAIMPWRLWWAWSYALPPVFRAISWLFTSREYTNFTYELDPLNLKQLTAYVAVVTGQSYATIQKYIQELDQDEALKSHIIRLSQTSKEKWVADPVVHFGRRLGWYAILRVTKPQLAVETGTDKGLGTCVIAAALMRNAQEGSPGKVISMDINPNAGYLFQTPYNQYGKLLCGSSHQLIAELNEEVDFFIHDSNHAAEYEAKEFELIRPKLSRRALVLSDNSELTDELLKFAEATGRKFLFFAEKPIKHWSVGAGIGAGF